MKEGFYTPLQEECVRLTCAENRQPTPGAGVMRPILTLLAVLSVALFGKWLWNHQYCSDVEIQTTVSYQLPTSTEIQEVRMLVGSKGVAEYMEIRRDGWLACLSFFYDDISDPDESGLPVWSPKREFGSPPWQDGLPKYLEEGNKLGWKLGARQLEQELLHTSETELRQRMKSSAHFGRQIYLILGSSTAFLALGLGGYLTRRKK